MIIDATDLLLGRMASFAAKKSLLGENVDIVNCENAVISGNRRRILADYKQKRSRGIPAKGPFISRLPDRLVRRAIKGMLPYKKPRGRKAFTRIMCYMGVPDKFKDKKLETLKNCDITKLNNLKYIYIKEISKELGAKLR